MFEILVNSIDRTEYIVKGSLSIDDIETSQVDTASFSIKNKDWIPQKGDEIIINFDGNREFGGRIVDVKKSDRVFLEIQVECQDWSVDLDRKKIAKVYDNLTAKEIIEDIIDTVNTEMGTSFTTANVQDTQVFGKVVFNYQESSKCIEELANVLNWHWYIDAFKDVHFFAKGMEAAPFSVNDTSPDVIRETLEFDDSFSELRNVIVLRGGEFVGSARTETYISDGSQTTLNLAYKFSSLPDVEIEGSPIAVGIENLDNQGLEDDTFVALWDYNQKYLRFKTAPAEGDEITITGTPLFPLIVQIEEPNSIAEFGRKEHLIVDSLITSVDTAIERCISDLEAYKGGVQGGSFMTYSHGLKSGQTIVVNSTKLDTAEVFLIRSVNMVEHGNSGALYKVELASNKVIGIIEFLQKLLLDDRKKIGIRENEVPNIIKLDNKEIEVEEEITRINSLTDFQDLEIEEEVRFDPFEAVFVLAPYFPVDDSDPKTPMILGVSSYLYPP
jgi:hypothetical protein